MVNSDGAAYLEYEVRNIGPTRITSDTLYLMRIAADDTNTSTVLSSTTENQALLPGPIVPDGQGGVVATWTIFPSRGAVPQYPYQAADVVSMQVGTTYNLQFSPTSVSFGKSPTIVLGENGVAFAAGSSATDQIVSFNVTSGTVNWTYQATGGNKLSIVASISGNGLVAKTTDQNGNDTMLTFNSLGATQDLARRDSSISSTNPMAEPMADTPVSGISNTDYRAENGSLIGTIGNDTADVSWNLLAQAATPGARPKGDEQHNGTTDPGFKLVRDRDCSNKSVVHGYTAYERLPIYELWDSNKNPPAKHYTVFEYVVDNLGQITFLTRCPDNSNTGMTPCQYADGTSTLVERLCRRPCHREFWRN